MKKEMFDVLIVYSEGLATSANTLKNEALLPFAKGSSSESYNVVYGYFLKLCQKNGLKAAFTTSADIVGAGKCQSYWLYKSNSWIKVKKTGYSKLIFDKFSPVNKKVKFNRRLLFSSQKIKPFNQPDIFDLFFDKQKTYDKLHQFSIPTVTIKNSGVKSVYRACSSLKEIMSKHPHKEDFSDEIIMKDRFGAGGINVYKFKIDQTKKMVKTIKKHNKKSFIIQSFVRFNKGFSYKNSPVSTDIRLIYLGGKIIQTYIRMAKAGDFRCNEHQGGTLKYISKSQVPLNVLLTSNKIAKLLNKNSSLYALDFIISNNGNTYLLEGNTGPGLDWNLQIKKNRIESQKLIRIIVKELFKLARPPVKTTKKEAVELVVGTTMTDKNSILSNELVLA
jgi:glutathione synthase/RimK-type ligase-like ATP-grasp enzyme